jgi:hypothetical protein
MAAGGFEPPTKGLCMQQYLIIEVNCISPSLFQQGKYRLVFPDQLIILIFSGCITYTCKRFMVEIVQCLG